MLEHTHGAHTLGQSAFSLSVATPPLKSRIQGSTLTKTVSKDLTAELGGSK